jgi:hypothetical protein
MRNAEGVESLIRGAAVDVAMHGCPWNVPFSAAIHAAGFVRTEFWQATDWTMEYSPLI